MNLTQAKLNDVYRLWISKDGNITSSPSRFTVLGTVIGKREGEILFGWKENQVWPSSAKTRSGDPSPTITYVTNQREYKYSKLVPTNTIVMLKIGDEPDGLPCKKCRSFFEYAEPNQDDGTLVCWSCRTTW